MSQYNGKFITIEGIEGTGKSTVLKAIASHLTERGIKHLITREPGGTPIAEAIRGILLSHYDETMCPETELMLYFAGRAQHLTAHVIPALEAGKFVISDRYVDASYAYQGGGRQIPEAKIDALVSALPKSLSADMTLLFDTPVEIGMKRMNARGEKDRMEIEQVDFFERVRETYLKRAEKYPDQFRVIDASADIETVKQKAIEILQEIL